MPENNTNNFNGNLTKQSKSCHSQYDDQIHYYQKHEYLNKILIKEGT
jgi:hypothetical protein